MPFYSLGGLVPSTSDDDRYWIAPDAMLIGDVRLALDVGIWFGAVLRADHERISIGASSNVQDNCVLHTDPGYPVTIGEFCTLGHNATVHGCSVGDGSLIGMGATILNGARVGRSCLVAANTLIAENVVIPDHSLVRGVPGRVAGVLDDARIASMRAAAVTYVASWQRYRTELRRIDTVAGARRVSTDVERRPSFGSLPVTIVGDIVGPADETWEAER